MLKNIGCLFFYLSFISNCHSYDLTLIGEFKYAGSISRLGFTFAQMLKEELNINFINCKKSISYRDAPEDLIELIKSNINNEDGKVALLYSPLWHVKYDFTKKIPQNSKIKLAYSMLESNRIPDTWVNLLNARLDAVVVPDDYWREVYEKCGVSIPIFVLPCPLELKEYLNNPIKSNAGKPFIFGCSATFIARKNYNTLVRAFAEEFGNNKNVLLRLQGRYGRSSRISSFIKKLKLENIEIITKPLSQKDYINFISSIDCYTYISKGEGFSISPREAMALGIPCILSDNTAQSTICKTGLVCPVVSKNLEAAYHGSLGKSQLGYFFNCNISDVRKALRKVYDSYNDYLNKAEALRAWAAIYSYENLKPYYLTLFKPTKVVLGKENKITSSFLMTNSKGLYQKYHSNFMLS